MHAHCLLDLRGPPGQSPLLQRWNAAFGRNDGERRMLFDAHHEDSVTFSTTLDIQQPRALGFKKLSQRASIPLNKVWSLNKVIEVFCRCEVFVSRVVPFEFREAKQPKLHRDAF